MSIYDIDVTTIDGNETTLSSFKRSVLLIVNVASKCGFTSQYEGLEKLFQKYQAAGLVVLGFPCNQFKKQEPGTEEEIMEFCRLTYGVSFPMFAKIDVNGANTHPLYTHLKRQCPGVLGSESIKWNFTKFLVDREGNVLKRYATSVDPSAIDKDIVQALDT